MTINTYTTTSSILWTSAEMRLACGNNIEKNEKRNQTQNQKQESLHDLSRSLSCQAVRRRFQAVSWRKTCDVTDL